MDSRRIEADFGMLLLVGLEALHWANRQVTDWADDRGRFPANRTVKLSFKLHDSGIPVDEDQVVVVAAIFLLFLLFDT